MDSEKFVRCLSKNHMKIGVQEQLSLVSKLKNEMDQINYQDFLKYSFLCHLFFNHLMLEDSLREADQAGEGQITVAQLEEILASKHFALPPNALDQVF